MLIRDLKFKLLKIEKIQDIIRKENMDAFYLVTQVDTNIVLSLLFIECQKR